MDLYFTTREAEERRIAFLQTAENQYNLEALRAEQAQRFVRVPTVTERLIARLQHVVRRTKLAVQPQ